MTTGLSGLGAVMAATLVFEPDTSVVALLVWFFLAALSMGWVMAPATGAVIGAVPAAKSGVASAMNTVARMVSGALGVAIVGSLIIALYASDMEQATSALPPRAADAASESIGAAHQVAAQAPGPGACERLLATAADAFKDAMGAGLLVAALLSFAAAAVTASVLRSRRRVLASSPA